jgi:hypothetical protein
MRRFVTALIALAVVLAVAPASAEDDDPVKTKFYDMGELVIDGGIQKPLDTLYMHHHKPQFARLLSLKKSFLGKIADTAKEAGTR